MIRPPARRRAADVRHSRVVELREIEILERPHHAIERVAPRHLVPRGRAEQRGARGREDQRLDRRRERRRDRRARPAVRCCPSSIRSSRPPTRLGDHRQAGGHRFDRAVGKRLGPRRQDERDPPRRAGPARPPGGRGSGRGRRGRATSPALEARPAADRRRRSGTAGADGGAQLGRGGEQDFVRLLGAEVGDGEDRRDRPPRGSPAAKPSDVDAVGDDTDAIRGDPFGLELARGGASWPRSRCAQRYAWPLQRDLAGALVGVQFAPAADRGPARRPARPPAARTCSRRDRTSGGRRCDARGTSGRTRRRWASVAGRAKPRIGKAGDRRAGLDARQPGAFLVKAGDVHVEPGPVEPLDEFGHLPFGAAGMEAR